MIPHIHRAFIFTFLILAGSVFGGFSQKIQAAANVSAEQRPDTRLVDITYDLSQTSTLEFEARTDPSGPWVPMVSVTGDVGPGVTAGTGKSAVWDAGADLSNSLFPSVTVRVLAVPEISTEPYSVSGSAVQITPQGQVFAITNGTGVTVTAVQYSDNTCIEATFNILGHWEIHGIVGPARIIATFDRPDWTTEHRMDPNIIEVTGPTEGIQLNRIPGDDSDLEQCPDLTPPDTTEIFFADLEPAVRNQLNLAEGEPITVDLAITVSTLPFQFTSLPGNITDLSGAEHLVSLTQLNLNGNFGLTDITPLTNLPLQNLFLGSTAISSLEPLANMPLRDLVVSYTNVTDLSPLSGITSLETLVFHGYEGSGTAALATLENLSTLELVASQVTDLGGIGALPALEILRLNGLNASGGTTVTMRAPISDLSPLAQSPSLRWLFINNTDVTDLAPLCSIPTLELVSLQNGLVSDLSPLLDLPNLQTVNLRYLEEVDWENYANGWAVVDALEANGVNVNIAFNTGPVTSLPYNLTGVVEGTTGLGPVTLRIQSVLGTVEETVMPEEPWQFPARGTATVTPTALGYSFEPESVTAPNRPLPPIVFTATRLIGISGQVLDTGDQPVAGLEIQITRTDTEPPETEVVTTAADGRYFAEYPFEADLLLQPISLEYAVEPVDGRPLPVVTSGGFVVNFTAHSRPDGILAVTRSGSTSLISTLDGSTLASAILTGFGPIWSPDGERLAVTRDTGSTNQLIVANADGSNATIRVRHTDLNPNANPGSFFLKAPYDWSSNNEILFTAQYVVGASSVSGSFPYRVDADSGQPVSLLPNFTSGNNLVYTPGFFGGGAWAPDGERYVIDSILDSATGPAQFRVGRRGQSALTALPLGGSRPAWSPDGGELLYSTGERLYAVTIDADNNTGEPVDLGPGISPTWSPDGRWIAFEHNGQIRVRPRHAPTGASAALAPGLQPSWRP